MEIKAKEASSSRGTQSPSSPSSRHRQTGKTRLSQLGSADFIYRENMRGTMSPSNSPWSGHGDTLVLQKGGDILVLR